MNACYHERNTINRLGIQIRHARPGSGQSKGKVEKFHKIVDSFLREVKLKNVTILVDIVDTVEEQRGFQEMTEVMSRQFSDMGRRQASVKFYSEI
jgi:hypothetical protein